MQLRPLTLNDSKDFFYATWDEKIHQYMPGYYCDNLKKAENVIKNLTSSSHVKAFAIITEKSEFAGVIVICFSDKEPKKAEISYFIKDTCRKKGLAYKAVRELLKSYRGYTVYFQIDDDNIRSKKVVEKLNLIQDSKYDELYYLENI